VPLSHRAALVISAAFVATAIHFGGPEAIGILGVFVVLRLLRRAPAATGGV
jgi:hypothetical protein